jgi:hypothetical protein
VYTSLYSPEVQSVLSAAEAAAGTAAGPFPSPADSRDQVIYFLMVDRFALWHARNPLRVLRDGARLARCRFRSGGP